MGQSKQTEYFDLPLNEEMPCKKKKTWSLEALDQSGKMGQNWPLGLFCLA